MAMGHYLLGLAHLGNKDIQQAKTSLIEAVKLNPQWSEARLMLADLYFKTGAFDLAIEEAQEILKADPNSIQALLIAGNSYLMKRDAIKAQESFEEVKRLAPNNPVGYYHMGRTLIAQRKIKEGLTQLEKGSFP